MDSNMKTGCHSKSGIVASSIRRSMTYSNSCKPFPTTIADSQGFLSSMPDEFLFFFGLAFVAGSSVPIQACSPRDPSAC